MVLPKYPFPLTPGSASGHVNVQLKSVVLRKYELSHVLHLPTGAHSEQLSGQSEHIPFYIFL